MVRYNLDNMERDTGESNNNFNIVSQDCRYIGPTWNLKKPLTLYIFYNKGCLCIIDSLSLYKGIVFVICRTTRNTQIDVTTSTTESSNIFSFYFFYQRQNNKYLTLFIRAKYCSMQSNKNCATSVYVVHSRQTL